MMKHDHGGLAAAERRVPHGNPEAPARDDRFEADPRGDAGPFATGVGFMGRVTGALGGLSATALVAGLALWTYDLAVRDLSEVPVVRALEGPVRIAPDDPGGDVAEHQGLAVNAIQADAGEEDAPARVVLAPRAPDLAKDDVAVAVAEDAQDPPVEVADKPAPVLENVVTYVSDAAPVDEIIVIETEPGVVDPIQAALAEALGMEPPEEGDADPDSVPSSLEPTLAVAIIGPDGSVTGSPRPSARPDERLASMP